MKDMMLKPDHAKMRGTIASMTTNGKKTVLKIEITNQMTMKNYPFLSQNIEEEIETGQMELDL